MTEFALSGAPGGVEAVLEDDLSYRSSAPNSGTDTPTTRSLTSGHIR
jgi:hypothetical protein